MSRHAAESALIRAECYLQENSEEGLEGAEEALETARAYAHAAYPQRWTQEMLGGPIAALRVAIARQRQRQAQPRQNPYAPRDMLIHGGLAIERVGRMFVVRPYGWRYSTLQKAKAVIDKHVAETAPRRPNPMGSYRGVPYTASAGVYRLRTQQGTVTFTQRAGGMAALRAYVDRSLR